MNSEQPNENQDNRNQGDWNRPNMNSNNINHQNMSPPRKRMGLGFFISPLLIDYGVTILVQVIISCILFIGVFRDYVEENPEIATYISGEAEMDDSFYEYLTTDVTDDLTEDLYVLLDENFMLITAVSSLALIPIFAWMMRRDKAKYGNMQRIMARQQEELWKYLFIILGSITLCVALNNIINLSQLAEVSQYYQEASETLYSGSYILQLVAYGVITPFAEEYLFRGIIYNRLRLHQRVRGAMIWSALIFAIYHGNLVQMVYAGICGLVLVWLYERYGSLKAPILAHICMNLTALMLTQYDLFLWIFDNQYRMMGITAGCAAITATVYVTIDNITRRISME